MCCIHSETHMESNPSGARLCAPCGRHSVIRAVRRSCGRRPRMGERRSDALSVNGCHKTPAEQLPQRRTAACRRLPCGAAGARFSCLRGPTVGDRHKDVATSPNAPSTPRRCCLSVCLLRGARHRRSISRESKIPVSVRAFRHYDSRKC